MITYLKKQIPDKQKVLVKKAIVNFKSLFFPYNLDKLAELYKTDKYGSHNYTKLYKSYLKRFKFKRIKLLEIGVGGNENSMSRQFRNVLISAI